MCDNDGKAYIMDKGSHNGTFVNGDRIEGDDEPMLEVGHIITIARNFHIKVVDIQFE